MRRRLVAVLVAMLVVPATALADGPRFDWKPLGPALRSTYRCTPGADVMPGPGIPYDYRFTCFGVVARGYIVLVVCPYVPPGEDNNLECVTPVFRDRVRGEGRGLRRCRALPPSWDEGGTDRAMTALPRAMTRDIIAHYNEIFLPAAEPPRSPTVPPPLRGRTCSDRSTSDV